MKSRKPVSPYLTRPLRSLQDVLRSRGDQFNAMKTGCHAGDEVGAAAGNNNMPLLGQRANSA